MTSDIDQQNTEVEHPSMFCNFVELLFCIYSYTSSSDISLPIKSISFLSTLFWIQITCGNYRKLYILKKNNSGHQLQLYSSATTTTRVSSVSFIYHVSFVSPVTCLCFVSCDSSNVAKIDIEFTRHMKKLYWANWQTYSFSQGVGVLVSSESASSTIAEGEVHLKFI